MDKEVIEVMLSDTPLGRGLNKSFEMLGEDDENLIMKEVKQILDKPKKLPYGVIAVHGYRKQFTFEEQEEIVKALRPIIEETNKMMNDWNQKHVIIQNPDGTWNEVEI